MTVRSVLEHAVTVYYDRDTGPEYTNAPAVAQQLLDAYRDEVRAQALREAADVAVRVARSTGDDEAGQYAASQCAHIGAELRRMADAAAPEGGAR